MPDRGVDALGLELNISLPAEQVQALVAEHGVLVVSALGDGIAALMGLTRRTFTNVPEWKWTPAPLHKKRLPPDRRRPFSTAADENSTGNNRTDARRAGDAVC